MSDWVCWCGEPRCDGFQGVIVTQGTGKYD